MAHLARCGGLLDVNITHFGFCKNHKKKSMNNDQASVREQNAQQNPSRISNEEIVN
jgi:hypothetical protein